MEKQKDKNLLVEKSTKEKPRLHKDVNAKLSLGILAGVVVVVGIALIFLNQVVSNLSHFITPFSNPYFYF